MAVGTIHSEIHCIMSVINEFLQLNKWCRQKDFSTIRPIFESVMH